MLRALLLAGLLAAFSLWLARHTGRGLSDPRVIGGLGGLLVAALWALDKVFSAVDPGALGRWYQRLVTFALDLRVLAGFAVAIAFLMLNLSSIVVLPEGSRAATVTVEAVGSTGRVDRLLCPPGEPTGAGPRRFCVWTGPFGAGYRVSVEGYLPRLFEVYPLTGLRLVPAVDLERSPSVLIRPDIKALDTLSRCDEDSSEPDGKRCGLFTLCRFEQSRCVPLLAQQRHVGSFLIGWPQAVPAGLVEIWRQELIAGAMDPANAAKTLLSWRRQKVYKPGSPPGDATAAGPVPPLSDGDRLRAEVRTKAKDRVLVSCADITVEDAAFMDIAMLSALEGGDCKP